MAQSKVQQDRYSHYVRSGGHLFRPAATHSRIGQRVQVTPLPGTRFARVQNDAFVEFWHSHGRYLDHEGRRLDSEYLYLGPDFDPFAEGMPASRESAERAGSREVAAPVG